MSSQLHGQAMAPVDESIVPDRKRLRMTFRVLSAARFCYVRGGHKSKCEIFRKKRNNQIPAVMIYPGTMHENQRFTRRLIFLIEQFRSTDFNGRHRLSRKS